MGEPQLPVTPFYPDRPVRPPLFVALLLLLLLGCDARIEHFDANELYALTLATSRSTATTAASQDAASVVEQLFGTPDSPRWPDSVGLPKLSQANLQRAAGPVSSEKDGTHRGLFREHCVVCHGLSGSGAGPASSVQNPYPRDFRFGVYKWKSTQRSDKPTRADLRQLIVHGVPGTAMPSFATLQSDDLEALLDYVIYLSVRGEVERALLAAAVDELDYGDESPGDELRLSTGNQTEGGQVVIDVVSTVAAAWQTAATIPVPAWEPLDGSLHAESVQRGKDIFHGQIANCVGCHGPAGNGNAVTLDYDDWTKEFSTRIGLTPTNRDQMRPFRQAGALIPRQINPRNLQDGVFRGGDDPETLFRRISQGIAGTPMPAVEVVATENGKGLTASQMWDLIRYVKSLGTAPETTR
jgi:mono/diheme cytochrome c family protein